MRMKLAQNGLEEERKKRQAWWYCLSLWVQPWLRSSPLYEAINPPLFLCLNLLELNSVTCKSFRFYSRGRSVCVKLYVPFWNKCFQASWRSENSDFFWTSCSIFVATKFSLKWEPLWRVIQFTSTDVEHITLGKFWAGYYGRYNDDTWFLLLEDFFWKFTWFFKKRCVGFQYLLYPEWKKRR